MMRVYRLPPVPLVALVGRVTPIGHAGMTINIKKDGGTVTGYKEQLQTGEWVGEVKWTPDDLSMPDHCPECFEPRSKCRCPKTETFASGDTEPTAALERATGQRGAIKDGIDYALELFKSGKVGDWVTHEPTPEAAYDCDHIRCHVCGCGDDKHLHNCPEHISPSTFF